jgi:hypothetical protein
VRFIKLIEDVSETDPSLPVVGGKVSLGEGQVLEGRGSCTMAAMSLVVGAASTWVGV